MTLVSAAGREGGACQLGASVSAGIVLPAEAAASTATWMPTTSRRGRCLNCGDRVGNWFCRFDPHLRRDAACLHQPQSMAACGPRRRSWSRKTITRLCCSASMYTNPHPARSLTWWGFLSPAVLATPFRNNRARGGAYRKEKHHARFTVLPHPAGLGDARLEEVQDPRLRARAGTLGG